MWSRYPGFGRAVETPANGRRTPGPALTPIPSRSRRTSRQRFSTQDSPARPRGICALPRTWRSGCETISTNGSISSHSCRSPTPVTADFRFFSLAHHRFAANPANSPLDPRHRLTGLRLSRAPTETLYEPPPHRRPGASPHPPYPPSVPRRRHRPGSPFPLPRGPAKK